jgi:hypothetical protein
MGKRIQHKEMKSIILEQSSFDVFATVLPDLLDIVVAKHVQIKQD